MPPPNIYPKMLQNYCFYFLLIYFLPIISYGQDKQESRFFKQLSQAKPDKAAVLLAQLNQIPKQRSMAFWLKKADFYNRLSLSAPNANAQTVSELQDSALLSLNKGMYFYSDSTPVYQSQKALWLYTYWQERAVLQRQLLNFYSEFIEVIGPTRYYLPLHRYYFATTICKSIGIGQIDADSGSVLYSKLAYKNNKQGLDWQKYNQKSDSLLGICFAFDCKYANNVVAGRLNGRDSLLSAKRILSIMAAKRCPYSLAYGRATAIVLSREPSYGLCMQAGRYALAALLFAQAENYFAQAFGLAGHPARENEALYWQAKSVFEQKKPWPALELLTKIREPEAADTKKHYELVAQIWESKPIVPTSKLVAKPNIKNKIRIIPDSLFWAWGALQAYKKAKEPIKVRQIESKLISFSKLVNYNITNGQKIFVPNYPKIEVAVVAKPD